MEENLVFNNISELYDRVLPALHSKTKELSRMHLAFIREKDIFNYLIDTKWCNSKDLCLAEVVDDILNVNIARLSDYTQKNIISKQEKESGYDE